MQSRRIFIGKVASGLAGAIAAPNVLAASDRIRIGIIGPATAASSSCEALVPIRNSQALPISTPSAWKPRAPLHVLAKPKH